jgi:hypothetical protein
MSDVRSNIERLPQFARSFAFVCLTSASVCDARPHPLNLVPMVENDAERMPTHATAETRLEDDQCDTENTQQKLQRTSLS